MLVADGKEPCFVFVGNFERTVEWVFSGLGNGKRNANFDSWGLGKLLLLLVDCCVLGRLDLLGSNPKSCVLDPQS